VFKRSRWLLLKNPWNLNSDQKEHLSTLARWNTPIVRAYYLKESFQLVLPATGSGQRPSREMDAVGHAVAPGTIQEICASAAGPSGRDPALDQAARFQWRR
jgi:transposase